MKILNNIVDIILNNILYIEMVFFIKEMVDQVGDNTNLTYKIDVTLIVIIQVIRVNTNN